MHKPKVAIITRTKDRPLLLERTINTVLAQTFDDWVHIIVNDNGNKQELETLVEQYKSRYNDRIKIIHNEVSNGMEAASNVGIKNSESEYIVILDDDDSWEKDFLSATSSYLDENSTIGGVMTHSNYVIEEIDGSNIKTLEKYPYNTDILNINLFDTILKKVYPPTMSFVFRRSCYDSLNAFNEEFLKFGDIEFVIRFLTKFDIDVIPECLSNCHTRPFAPNVYANSSLGNKNYKDNSYWENKLKNHLLRLDFNENKTGVGFIYNILTTFGSSLKPDTIKSKLELCKNKKVVLYGAGIRAKELLENFKTEFNQLNIAGILDQNSQKSETYLNEYKIYAPDSIKELNPDIVLLMVANHTMVKPFVENLIRKNNLDSKIITF